MKSKIIWGGNFTGPMAIPLYMAGVLLVMDVLSFFFVRPAFWMLGIVSVIYVIFLVLIYVHYKAFVTESVISFATEYGTVQNQLLKEFEVPYAILDSAGRILWLNDRFSDVMGVSKNYRKSITSLFPSITREALAKKQEVMDFMVRAGEADEARTLRAHVRRMQMDENLEENRFLEISNSGDLLFALYLFDETELEELKTKASDEQMAAALVYIDNYDEAMESMTDVRRSVLSAIIDRKVNQYFSRMDGLVRKTEKDKYFIIFKYKYLDQMKEEKFRLLEDAKAVKAGNEIAVTLSIGIGAGGNNYNQTYEMCRAAIDLALGRGGDQVVLKQGESISYFGGKSQKAESKNRVKARVKAQALKEIIEASENVLIMGHNLSDEDALGAGIGVFCAARSVGKKAQIVINNPNTSVRPLIETFSVEKGYPEDLFIDSEQALVMQGKNTLIMVVDVNKPSYTECPQLLKKNARIVVLDHHRQGPEIIENPILSYVEPYASSACEMIAEVLQYFNGGIKLNSTEADCIYAGILVDTDSFVTKTGVRTFEAAAFLKRSGADVSRVRKMLREDMDAYKAKAFAISNASVFREKFAISACPSNNLESPTIVGAQAANELLNITGIQASFVLTEYNNKIYISARSIDDINVQIIMEKLGGGGHLNMAGAQLANCTISQARRRLENTLDEMIKKGDITA